jgi:hypothetical protein
MWFVVCDLVSLICFLSVHWGLKFEQKSMLTTRPQNTTTISDIEKLRYYLTALLDASVPTETQKHGNICNMGY